MNYLEIYTKATKWMIDRNWREFYGKRGAFTQSLLQHTDIELNVLLTLLPILAKTEHYGFSNSEQQSLIVGQIVHDVGKETEEWQRYVRAPQEKQRGRYVSHVLRPLTDDAVNDLVKHLGFPDSVVDDAIKFVNLHMAATRNSTNVLNAIIQPHNSKRWNILARIVATIDNLCSVPSLLPTLQAIEQDKDGAIAPHVKFDYHLLNLRGVSSVLLHKAVEQAFVDKGWESILYFGDGTIYVADALSDCSAPRPSEILNRLACQIEETMPTSGFAKFVVGDPRAAFLPKPDLFDHQEIETYLNEATYRIGRKSFGKKTLKERWRVVETFLSATHDNDNITDVDVDNWSERIGAAQPEMLAFKFFKAATAPDVVGKNGAFVQTPEVVELFSRLGCQSNSAKERKRISNLIKKLQKQATEDWRGQLQRSYESVFGEGSFGALQSTSTLMPAKEMTTIIYPFWHLPGVVFGSSSTFVKDMPDEERKRLLITKLAELAMEAYELLPESARPSRETPLEVAKVFIEDLIHPNELDSKALAAQQWSSYAVSKPSMFRDADTERICPICNTHFRRGTPAKADFLNKPESHTNRAIAHGRTGNIVICSACKFEIFFQQLLLGDRVACVLALAPRNHIGRWSGDRLVQEAQRFSEAARELMSNSTSNPNRRITLALTNVIAGKMTDSGDEVMDRLARAGLDANTLSDLLVYEMSPKKQTNYSRDLYKTLCEEYGLDKEESIISWNAKLDSRFESIDAMLEAIIRNDFSNELIDDIRGKIYRLDPQLRVVCQTPNFALIPMRDSFKVNKDSEANAALRELFTLLLLGLAFDCSVAVIDGGGEVPALNGGEGVALVPPVPSIRALIGSEWVGLTEARIWVEKIGAASRLAGATSYPVRSNLYQILTAPTPGHILRRIEMQSDSGYVSGDQVRLIEKATQSLPK